MSNNKARECANVLLDAVVMADPDSPTSLSEEQAEAATRLALQRLVDIEAITVWLEDDGTMRVEAGSLLAGTVGLMMMLLKSVTATHDADFATVVSTMRQHLLLVFPKDDQV